MLNGKASQKAKVNKASVNVFFSVILLTILLIPTQYSKQARSCLHILQA